MKRQTMVAMATVALLAGAAWAENVSESQARTVAENFAVSDSSLKSCAVNAVTKRGSLWIVSLKPSGYVAVSANDSAYPIAMFSAENFAEPCAGTPLAEMLAAIDSDIAKATGDAYRAAWDKLSASRRTLRTASLANAATTGESDNEVKVPVSTAWQQCQPFNDFMPIEYASGNSINSYYRGRRFLGCVPTAYVQIMNYWQWPEVLDSDVSEELNIPAEKYAGVNPITSYTPRIKSGTAMEWDGTQSQYPLDVSDGSGVSSGVYDLRGYLEEKKRLCVGRGCLLSQIISKASLMTTGTGATLTQPTYNDWYEQPTSIGHGSSGGDGGTDSDWYFGEVKKALQAGIPLLVGIDVKGSDGWIGHAVVGTGWKYENDSHFYELNYGWGGGSAYYSYESIKAHLGSSIAQRPQPKPLLVNQPEAAALPLTLTWHFPKKGWERVLTGFKVYASEYGMTLGDKTDTFDTNPGVASGKNSTSVFTGRYANIGNDTTVLIVKPEGSYGTKTYYTWNEPRTLSDTSALSFRVRANDTRGIEVTLQANIDGAGWNDAYKFARSDNAVADWKTVEVPLASGNAGKSIRFRLFIEKIASANGQWQDSAPVGYMIDDFTVKNVESIDAVNPVEVASSDDPAVRSLTITEGLNVGTRYALSVRPVFSEGDAIDSDYVPVMIVDEALAEPQIVSVASVPRNTSAPTVKEGCFRECALGLNYLWVQGSATMTELKAYSSHVSILPDDKITVESVPNHAGRFLVTIDGSDIDAAGGRQRMILTLVGENAYGAKVQKDLTLRFSSETQSEAEVSAADLDDGEEPGSDEPGDEPDEPADPDEPAEESPVVTPTFPVAAGAGPNDDTTAMTRFCPGVTKTSGWYDVNKTGTYGYIAPGAQDLVKWWAERYTTVKGSAPAGYTATADSAIASSDTGINYLGYLNTLLSGCSAASGYFPANTSALSPYQIYTELAKGPIGFCVKGKSTYYGAIWGCTYGTDSTGNYAATIHFTCSKGKNDGLESKALTKSGDSLTISGYGGDGTDATFEFFYPISAPEPEASGDGEVTVKVTAGGREFDISKAFSKVEKGADNIVTYTLDPTAKVKVQGEGGTEEEIAVQPELADDEGEMPFEIQDGKLVFRVKSIPGLKYQVLASDSLDPESFSPAGKEREAIGPRRELTVTRSGETKGFYKIQVSR